MDPEVPVTPPPTPPPAPATPPPASPDMAAPNMSQADMATAAANDPSIAKGADPAVQQSTAQAPGDATKTGFNPFGLTNDQAAKAGAAGKDIAADAAGMKQATANATGSPFDAIYGVSHMNMPGAPAQQQTIGAAPAALSPVNFTPPPALAVVPPGNTQVNPINFSANQGGQSGPANSNPKANVNISSPFISISDRRAKTNIQPAKRDIYEFLNALKVTK